MTAGGTGIHATEAGTAVISGGLNTVNTPGGTALNVNGGTANFAFSSVNVSGGSVSAIKYTNAGGTTTIGGGTITGNGTALPFYVNGGTASITYSGSMSQANSVELVRVEGGHNTGTIAFETGTLSATNGAGLQFSNADGTYNFNGTISPEWR